MSKKPDSSPATIEKTEDISTQVDEVMRKYDRESNTRIWEGTPKTIVSIFMAVFSVYCIFMTLKNIGLPETRLALFLGFITIAGYLFYPISKKNVKPNTLPWYDIVLMVLGAFGFFYFALNALTIIKLATKITPFLVIIGAVSILCLLELCRRCVGVPIMCVFGALLLYTFYFYFFQWDTSFLDTIKKIIYTLFYTTSGVIGVPINVCYKYIVLFIIFGAFLERTGIANFFISFANRIAGWSAGGPAKVAVISSALCGMVSGSSVGNTVTTGSFTIPMMKKTGYEPNFAGAVEAAASTGGQIMPPIMGAAAFLMAEYMGIPYAQVALKAILPAVLYFTGIFIAVHLEAKRLGLKGIAKNELPKWKNLGKECYLIFPLVLLVWLVATGIKTMQYSAAVSIIAAIVIGYINFVQKDCLGENESGEKIPFRKAALENLKKTCLTSFDALQAGSKGSITVAIACAMAGMIAGCITATGLASTLINSIVTLSENHIIIGLVLTMICCIILGMGVPTTANYCIMASTCAPILTNLGIPKVAAHFFVFYFGIVADITPPVALAAYAGAAIAKGNPMKTGINATKLAIAAFIVPYIFAYSPAMLFEGTVTFLSVIQTSVSALLGLYGIAAALNGHLYKAINPIFRLCLIGAGLCMMIPGTLTDVIGLAVIATIVAFQYITGKKTNKVSI